MALGLTALDWVARAKALAPLIESAAPRIDADSDLPPELVAALRDAGMYRLLIPRSCDGFELDVLTFAEIIETLAAADASTAWCIGQLSGCSMSAAYVELDVAREIFGPHESALAWGPPAGAVRADAVDGGYRVTGEWQFASGSRQANWLGATAGVFERDGTPRRNEAGRTVTLTVLFPRSSATITDVWHVVGLRGTGSDHYAVADLFVPAERTFVRDAAGWREPGPLYRLSTIYVHAVAFAAVALGIARAALDAYVELARTKRPRRGNFGAPLSENNTVQHHIGFAEARLRAVRAYLLASARDGWAEAEALAGGPIGLERRIDMRAAATLTIGTAAEIVDLAYRLAGATAIFENQPFERRFRDMHAVTQQVQGHQANYETIGQYRLDLPFELVI